MSTASSVPSDPTTDRFQTKRDAILVAAAQEFNQHGIKGVTLAGVAARVGLRKASLNYYYRRKEDLAADCMLQSVAAMQAVVDAALRLPTAAERIRAVLAGQAALLAEVAQGQRGELVSFNELRALAAAQGERVFAAYSQLFRSLRQCFPAALGWSRAQRNARTHLLLALTHGMRAWVQRYEAADYPEVARRLADLLLRGLAATPQHWHHRRGPPLSATRAGAEAAQAIDVREAFLRAATALVNEQGFRGASVESISARLNLTKGSFYHHHASKDELIGQCFERSFDLIRRVQQDAVARTPSGWERLVASTCALVAFQLSDEGPLLRWSARSALAEGARHDTVQRANQLTERFSLFIVDGMAEGAMAPVDAGVASQQVACTINAASSLRWWVPGIRSEEGVPLFVEPLFLGLLAPASA